MSAGGTTGYTRDHAGTLVGIRGSNRSYYLFDGLGSVVAVTSSSGSVTNSYTYDPFGVTTETKATLTNVFNPWRYTGQYQDTSTGLYKMGARYYQPELGRWTQPDPSGLEANAYLYVGGNPVNLVDPSGTFPALAVVAVVVAVAAVAPIVVSVVAGAKCTAGSETACKVQDQNAPFIDPQTQDDTGARSDQVDQSLPRGLLLLQQRAESASERWQKHEYLVSWWSYGKQQGCLLPSLAHGSSSQCPWL